MTRLQIAAATAVACLFAAVVGLYVARHDDAPDAATGYAGAQRPPGIPPARFALRDQDGKAVDARSLHGRPAVVAFLYTHCRDTCPVIADQVRGALDQLGSERAVPFVAVSVDPAGDTAQSARTFLLKHGLTRRARFLLGTRAQLAPVWRAFGVAPQSVKDPRRDDHTASTVILDARGRQRIGFPADQLTPEGLAHDVRTLSRQ